MVVSSVRRPASRCRGSWRPPTGAKCTFGKPELAAGGNCSELEKLQLDWPEAALPRCAGVTVVPSLRRPASRCRGTSRHQREGTPARRIPRRPSNLTCVAVPHSKRKHLLHHISSTTISTDGSMEPLGGRRDSATGNGRDFRSCLGHLPLHCQQSAGIGTFSALCLKRVSRSSS